MPFRGEYFELARAPRAPGQRADLPGAGPAFPFLGVHLTRMIDGGVHAGPNAVLALRPRGVHVAATSTSASCADSLA